MPDNRQPIIVLLVDDQPFVGAAIKRLLAGTLTMRGEMPCLGLFTLGEFLSEVADLDISAGIA